MKLRTSSGVDMESFVQQKIYIRNDFYILEDILYVKIFLSYCEKNQPFDFSNTTYNELDYRHFFERGVELTRKLLNQGLLLVKLKTSL
jgi:hypothetical protein